MLVLNIQPKGLQSCLMPVGLRMCGMPNNTDHGPQWGEEHTVPGTALVGNNWSYRHLKQQPSPDISC